MAKIVVQGKENERSSHLRRGSQGGQGQDGFGGGPGGSMPPQDGQTVDQDKEIGMANHHKMEAPQRSTRQATK